MRTPFRLSGRLCALLCLAAITTGPSPLSAEPLVTRAEWGAKRAVTKRMRRHLPTGIMIHHTAFPQRRGRSLGAKVRALQSFSMRAARIGKRRKPPWGDMPYHFYIGVSGRIAEGRNIAYAGDSNTRYETAGWIQIVLEGDFNREQPAPAQLAALVNLSRRLAAEHKIAPARISTHKDHASTSCPGVNLARLIPSLRAELRRKR